MAHRMGAVTRLAVGLLLSLGLVGCTTESLSRTAVPPPTFAAPAITDPLSRPRPAVVAAVPTRPAAAATVRVPAAGPALTPAPVRVSGRILLDPGHGGKDSGAEAGGIVEKWLDLEVATAAADELRRRGVTVRLTRSSDTFVELEDRARAANAFRPDLFVAVHADFNPSSVKVGHSILLPQSGTPQARTAAMWLSQALVAAGSPQHTIRQDDRGLYVLRHTTCPAIILEMGFLSNPTEASQLRNPSYRRQLAMAIANGIVDYLRRK